MPCSLNTMVLSTLIFQLNIAELPSLASINPADSAVNGGTVVTVIGTSFRANSLYCKIDTSIGLGTFVSSTEAQCLAPAHIVGTAPISVSSNNYEFSTNAVQITYRGMYSPCFSE